VVINRSDQPPAILLNDSPPRSWIRLSLVGHQSNRSAIGAAIEVHAGGRIHHRQVKGGGSYLSANDPRVLVGVGNVARVDRVEVNWPSGAHSTLTAPALRQTHVIHEPEGGFGAAGIPGAASRPSSPRGRAPSPPPMEPAR
jgi:hypothetical protein